MKERQILFSAPMVRAILEGRKTQTRRIMKFPTPSEGWHVNNCPFGKIGDRLWVKEALVKRDPDDDSPEPLAYYAADEVIVNYGWEWHWKRDYLPSMFCPRNASRITLEVTGIRAERLQEITEADALAEGIYLLGTLETGGGYKFARGEQEFDTAVEAYRDLWDRLNAARGFGWNDNPYVWVVEFKRI